MYICNIGTALIDGPLQKYKQTKKLCHSNIWKRKKRLVFNQNISGDQHLCFPLSTNQRFLMIVNMPSILSQEKSVQGIMVMAKCKCRLFLAAHNRIC